MKKLTFLVLNIIILGLFLPGPASAQDEAKLGEFTVLMTGLVTDITALERAYNPSVSSNIARTMRLEAYNSIYPELEYYRELVSGRTDINSIRLWSLTEALQSFDVTNLDTLAVLEEIIVRGTVLECDVRGIEPSIASQYVLSQYSSFVSDRGDFSHPDFDLESLSNDEFTQIYFNGFGLMALINMDLETGGGVNEAVNLYETAPHISGYLSTQFIIRGVDLDTYGLPLLSAVLFDDTVLPDVKEIYYGVIAEKLIIGETIFGSRLTISNDWFAAIEPWVYAHVMIEGRLNARESMGFPYGVSFGFPATTPELLLGLCGEYAADDIIQMLAANNFMVNLAGLDAMRWYDHVMWPDSANRLFELAEPHMESQEFAPAMLALEIFDTDASYNGEPYDAARMARIQANLPVMCDLMRRANDVEWIDYIYSDSWWNIYEEGSLVDELVSCLPMIANVINADWETLQSGEEVYFSVNEVEVITYFLPEHPEYFTRTSDAVHGFLVAELDSETINQFTVWGYIEYLSAAKAGGVEFDDEWMTAIVRVKGWADEQTVLIRGDELLSVLDELLF